MQQPDLLLYLSDQHGGLYAGFAGNTVVETPHLDALAAQGAVFNAAYTPCPLCVPARVSMLTGQLACHTGVFTNSGAISEDQPTFLHALANAGYETVLCGRMHFLGKDQRHGFTKRIMGDITVTYWGGKAAMNQELQGFAGTLGEAGCLRLAGAGNSPVLAYDAAVVEKAIEYLRQPHEKPQCLVVGTYAPHFPYVAPQEWYEHYLKKTDLPHHSHKNEERHPATAHKEQWCATEKNARVRAAYFGMISHMDEQIGRVQREWNDFLAREKRHGVFCYLSDHGDQLGERGLYGKKALYEGAVRVPMIFSGDKIVAGRQIDTPVSLVDVAPTLCGLCGATPLPMQDGTDLSPVLHGVAAPQHRAVMMEVVDENAGELIVGRAIRQEEWKLIVYEKDREPEQLFNVQNDPYEIVNVAQENPSVVAQLKKTIYNKWEIEAVKTAYCCKKQQHAILERWGAAHCCEQPDRWKIPDECVARAADLDGRL